MKDIRSRRKKQRRRRRLHFEAIEPRLVLASISGSVYADLNGSGVRDGEEPGVPGVQITLTGNDDSGEAVSRTFITTNEGVYTFAELAAGTYDLTEAQPAAMEDGSESTSVTDAVVGEDEITNIVLSDDQQNAGDNDFGESHLRAPFISVVWFLSSATSQDDVFREMVAIGEDRAGHIDLAAAIRNGTTDGVNNPPIALADSYDAVGGSPLNITTDLGVLANDLDADRDALTATLVSDPTDGALELNPDGSFVYTPTDGFTGNDSFTYTANDAAATSDTATVTITVSGVANEFRVDENSSAGTLVGSVTPAAPLGDNVIFDLDNPGIVEQLRLMPDDHITGDPAAPIVLVEYLDLQCPSCQQFHPIVEELEDDFVGDLLVVRRHLPLTSIHLNAFSAARSAEAAGRQGMFEAMADLMFENQRDWEFADDPQPFFDSHATTLGLNMAQFAADRTDPAVDARIQRDVDAAAILGATGTPTFYLNGVPLNLSEALNDFDQLIEDELDDFDDAFVIDRFTGDILVANAGALDFDTNPSFSLTVNATDLDGFVTEIPVTIDVNDGA